MSTRQVTQYMSRAAGAVDIQRRVDLGEPLMAVSSQQAGCHSCQERGGFCRPRMGAGGARAFSVAAVRYLSAVR